MDRDKLFEHLLSEAESQLRLLLAGMGTWLENAYRSMFENSMSKLKQLADGVEPEFIK